MHARISALLLAFVLALSGLATAQEITGTISGRIVDPQGLAVPGASVTITGPQGSKTVVTDSTGRFVAPFLTPGVYSIKAELQGFKTAEKKDVAVRLGQTADIPLTMEVGGLTETVEVTGSSTAIDTTTATIGANLDTAQLNQIPVGRTFAQAVYLTPGVSNSGTLGQANPSISGGSGLENQYVVDGANVTNTGYGGLGSYSGTFGSLGNATPYDFIKEIQVKTGGYEAEFGQATGGVVNVVTKSGTNQLRGSVFGYSQPDQLQSAYKQFQASNGAVNTVGSSVNDAGVEGGLPIVKNRLFFFGAVDPSWRITTLNAPPTFPLARLGDVDRKRRTISYAAKVTSQMGDNHRVDVSFFGDPSHGANGPQRTSALLVSNTASFSTLDYGGHQQAVRYSGVMTNSWLIDATWARSLNKIAELPSVNEWRVTDRTVTPNIITGGIGTYEVGNSSLNRQYQVKSTNIFSGHQVKYGFEYYDAIYSQMNGLTGPTFKAADGRQTATGARIDVIPAPEIAQGKVYRVTRANFNVGRNTPQIYWDFFAQDSWQVGSKLTINPGIRYEQEKMSGTIIKDWELKNNWAPRIGVTYDASGDGRTKVYANYGRFYARVPNDLATRSLSADDGFTRGDYFDAGLTQVVPEGVAAAGVTRHFILAGVGADTIDPKAKLTYTNEVLLGVDREIAANTTFGVRYVFRNMPQILEDIANCPMVAYELPQTSAICGSVEYILTNPKASIPVAPGTEFLGAHFDDPVHKYNSLEFTLNRRVTNWSTVASYRWSRLRGNFEGFYRDDNGQSDPGISSLYDFPTNDPSYAPFYAAQGSGDIRFLGAHNGILPLDRPHQIKLYANRVWGGFNLGTGVNLSSGKPLTAMAANPNYGSKGEIPVTARGAGIQTIDGFMKRTPFESQVDLQASYALRMAGERRVTLLADIFNLFNERRTLNYNQNTQLDNGPADPDFGKPISTILSGNPPQFQVPFSMRVGIRYEF
jgi:Carboxypeptidase regulatory-like domain/TonB-dependent Receptor Plug Domain